MKISGHFVLLLAIPLGALACPDTNEEEYKQNSRRHLQLAEKSPYQQDTVDVIYKFVNRVADGAAEIRRLHAVDMDAGRSDYTQRIMDVGSDHRDAKIAEIIFKATVDKSINVAIENAQYSPIIDEKVTYRGFNAAMRSLLHTYKSLLKSVEKQACLYNLGPESKAYKTILREFGFQSDGSEMTLKDAYVEMADTLREGRNDIEGMGGGAEFVDKMILSRIIQTREIMVELGREDLTIQKRVEKCKGVGITF